MQEIALKTEAHAARRHHQAGAGGARRRRRGRGGARLRAAHDRGRDHQRGRRPDASREDLENALEKVVDDGWEWKHVEDPDGPNAPSHVRASLVNTQVLVPLEGGKLALGR